MNRYNSTASASQKRSYIKKRQNYGRMQYRPSLARARALIASTAETKEIRYLHSAVGSAPASFASISYGASSVAAGIFGGVALGTAQNQRIGSSIYARGIRVFFPLQPGDNTNYLRFILIQPKNGATLNQLTISSDLFIRSVFSNQASSATQWSMPVDTNRYTVFFDKTFTMSFGPLDGASGTNLPSQSLMSFFVKCNKKLTWDDTGYLSNDYFLIGISDSAAVQHPGAVGGYVKAYFKDY